MTLQFEQQLGTAGPIDDPVLIDTTTDYAIGPFEEYNSPVMDVRAFNSWFLRMDITAVTAGQYDPWMIRVRFYTDPSGDAEFRTFVDTFIIFPTQPFAIGGALFFTDQMHGPYMTLDVLDYSVAGKSATLDYNLYGSYRSMPGPYIRIDDSERSTGCLLDDRSTYTSAVTNQEAVAPGYGPISLQVRAPIGVTVTTVVNYAGLQVTETYVTVGAAGATTLGKYLLIAPKCQIRLDTTHNGAGNQQIHTMVNQQFQPY